jgi:hypothetical protein
MRTLIFLIAAVFVATTGAMIPADAGARSSSLGSSVANATDTLSLSRPSVKRYDASGWIKGTLAPARAGVSVELIRGGTVLAQTQTLSNGGFGFDLHFVSPGPYLARSGPVKSTPMTARIRPSITASLRGDRLVGQQLQLQARIRPATAGKLRLIVQRGHRRVLSRYVASGKPFALTLSKAARYVAWVEVSPNVGYTEIARKFRFGASAPALHLSSYGPAVRLLDNELIAHHFALLHADSSFGVDTLEAVYALQKFAGLSRSGRMSAAAWLALGRSALPRPRLRGTYIDVDKTKQVLYVVRDSTVILIVPVSTGATGNTPVGLFHVYSKIPGGAVMYYSNYFTGGFAIHGYVDVPPYPASHGCVRVPMWIAPHLYGLISLGERVYIHY